MTPVVASPPVPETRHVYLLPGMIHCATRASEVTTVLGSCVAVCLTDPASGISGMNHFVLPQSQEGHSGSRYGDVAIDQLVAAMRELCGAHCALEAKIFGGAEVLPATANGVSVGARNVAAALDRLERHGIPVVARRTGETTGFLIRLLSTSGDVLVRSLSTPVLRHDRRRWDGLATLA